MPAKIFEIKEEIDFGLIIAKLKDFREENLYRMDTGENITLATEILDINLNETTLSGVFSKDFVRRRFYKRQLVETPVTEECSFWISRFNQRLFLIVSAPSVARGVKQLLTNYVANKLSKVLFITQQAIVEVKISDKVLREVHESNPQSTKLIWFDEVDIPGVNKLCLAGSDLVDTTLYHDYLQHGRIWYVVFEIHNRGIVVGITRNCVVTLFSKSSAEEFISYLLAEVLGLVE